MCFSRLALCLILLGSRLAFAQTPEEWTPYTPPANQGPTPPPLVPAPTPSETPPPSQPPAPAPAAQTPPEGEQIHRSGFAGRSEGSQTALRLIVDPWAGTITGMMGLIIGLVPTALVALPFCLGTQDGLSPACAITLGTGMSLSYVAGITAGIAYVGKTMGGRGEILPTCLGGLAGAALGAGLGVATRSNLAFAIGMSVAPLLGAVLGYEFSHAMAMQEDTPALQARSGFRVMPMAGATPRGGVLGGFAGQF